MNRAEKFEEFLNTLKTPANAGLVESIRSGFKAIHEASGALVTEDEEMEMAGWKPSDDEDFDGISPEGIMELEDDLADGSLDSVDSADDSMWFDTEDEDVGRVRAPRARDW